jgi:hypothetical protein
VNPETPNPRPQTRFILVLAAIGLAFVYILSTEVLDRWSATVGKYQEVLRRENSAVAPESLVVQRRILKARSASLHDQLNKATGSYSRTLAGFLSHASEAARKHDVKLKEILPGQSSSAGEEGDLRFKVACSGEYHQIGFLVNALENSPLDVHITKVEMARGEKPAGGLVAVIEGRFRTESDPPPPRTAFSGPNCGL